jgi:hypothetical protein
VVRGRAREVSGLAVAVALLLGSPAGPAWGVRLVEADGPGKPAPASLVAELRGTVADVVARFEARDAVGVLARVSDQYRTGPLTKPAIREQLLAIYAVYDAVRARVRIDDVRVVDGHAWIYSSGEVSGQLPVVGTWIVFLSWQRELEVARRETGGWRLFGYQQ